MMIVPATASFRSFKCDRTKLITTAIRSISCGGVRSGVSTGSVVLRAAAIHGAPIWLTWRNTTLRGLVIPPSLVMQSSTYGHTA
jgi:hypothetical protein